ncbi:MAG: ribonuclease P protein component [Gloeomargarita sp. SKYBB_i_bin120]|nr:ribonuclease P protein component [Gloeomargarita sp. SKYB120]MDW8178687.1 ribonuclease P protein component [Gloeomargarita sp. SKYBB_i_bin120]
MGLPRIHRLRGYRTFEALYADSQQLRGERFRLRYRRVDEQTPAQFAVVVSNKLVKKAVRRNRLKRQIRAALRQLLPRCTRGWQVIVSAQPAALTGQYADFLRELEQLLQQAGVLYGDSGGRVL